ncbi:MAG TPA: hypothetical protein VFU82_05425 [Gammaproteobacteria bacterium]|nr:hypothetical protein [Gammaproteobacteria bacterium]
MPINQNPVVSIVSMHFFNREAVRAVTKMDGVIFTTDYYGKDDPDTPIGYSAGRKNGIYVYTNYFDPSDTKRQNPIGYSASAQNNAYSEINYYHISDTNKTTPIGIAEIRHNVPFYTATYFDPSDTKRQHPLGTSTTKRDVVLFTTEYEFSPEAINAQKNKPAPQIKLHENPHTLHAKPKAPPEPQMAQPKNEKNKCCSIM